MIQRQLTFGEAVQRALTVNYCNFSGRSSRSEYWWFSLFSFIVSFVIMILFCWSDTLEYIVSGLCSLYFLLPTLGVSVRRLHDTGRSGWWIFINIIPFFGQLIYLYFTIQPSQTVVNKWGPEPNMMETWN
ncbi:MAG: DUF805 domain-containing protein [Duncaniella sp.]|nr:DUF805 domain-containing protein [Bacteroides sp.]MDE5828077.1 DUF805 domain-containing protein [Duncaniella sp.]MBD5319091.1 DUF805 domain-containing protein [Bacteroides sp.]MBD5354834.1 DUF805 domain-containing protein [Bacteroides sp.]MDE6430130.1 DUF805 domain-containing protein [Duncaniella sp.]